MAWWRDDTRYVCMRNCRRDEDSHVLDSRRAVLRYEAPDETAQVKIKAGLCDWRSDVVQSGWIGAAGTCKHSTAGAV